MKSEKKCMRLAERIREILSQGLEMSHEVLHYVDSTFSNPSTAELTAFISDEDNCEKDALTDLIFFPDESLQIQLEDMLEQEGFQKTDEERIAGYLCEHPLETAIRFPDSRGGFSLSMPDWVAGIFVSRLNISKKLDTKLTEAISTHADLSDGRRFKVRLRNARFDATENKTRFLCRFFEELGAFSGTGDEYLDFLLNFLDELQKDGDIFQGLTEKKKFCFQTFQKVLKSEELLNQKNMETLILQGVRIPYADKNDLLRQMDMIDDISFSIFGKTGDAGDTFLWQAQPREMRFSR
ncbi:MAG: hypothetical protein B6245_15595 [Desulfobacteraceae bacterium 4572_88]|nr:MAG: hypothetical protein B6245_15595 [Desulfobacteraceae bacterium 4572_88]